MLGTYHGSELGDIFDGKSEDEHAYYINFVNSLDPSEGEAGHLAWPQWKEGQELMWFEKEGTGTLADDFREESYSWIK